MEQQTGESMGLAQRQAIDNQLGQEEEEQQKQGSDQQVLPPKQQLECVGDEQLDRGEVKQLGQGNEERVGLPGELSEPKADSKPEEEGKKQSIGQVTGIQEQEQENNDELGQTRTRRRFFDLAASIQLLRLLPHSDQNSRIECQLLTCSLLSSARTHPYEALSYTWGLDKSKEPIWIEGNELSVGANLYKALLHLRDGFVERILWVDAICINQNDNTGEKEQQVQSMAKIYSKASRAIVWLGEATDNGDQALEVIRAAAAATEGEQKSTDYYPMDKSSNKQAAVFALLGRDWFQRIWTLQEVATARHILIKCGFAEIDGYAFTSGLSALNLFDMRPDLGAVFRPKYRGNNETSQLARFSLNIRPLSKLVDIYHTHKATIPLDKVYALSGISSDNPDGAGFKANYKTREEVAVIEAKGCVLDKVSSARKDTNQHDSQSRDITQSDRQYVDISWGIKGGKSTTTTASVKTFPTDLLLVWDWDDESQKDYAKLIGSRDRTKCSVAECQCLYSLDRAARLWNIGLLLNRMERYKKRGMSRVVRLLIEKGADFEGKNQSGRTPLSWAAENDHEAVIQLLIEKGASADLKDKSDRTPLWWAAKNGHEAVVWLLIENGASVDLEDNYSRTPLLRAAENGHEAVIRLLVEKGADLDLKDKYRGQTSLPWAAEKGHEAVVRLLIKNGADLDSKDKSDQMPLW
ncbi:hypothetical protein QBC38DRAFT_511396 [Podospora fimiseda]|uniref:Heterokaryon incompatibility domain-containing protein n=1 Tax=Podospora fimiseda TaxID=252190 RepID=A0AAN7BK48_9PEZI|nr:hypothetical protein QBC38DRAFT_511396 [Podospora fimiseda]